MIRRPPRSTQSRSSAASDVYKRQPLVCPPIREGALNRPKKPSGRHAAKLRRDGITARLSCSFNFLATRGAVFQHFAPPERPGDCYGAPTSLRFGSRVLVSDLLHQPARKGNSIDCFSNTAVIDQLLAPITEQLRRAGNRILYQFDVERHQDAGRHGEALGRIEPVS